MNHSRKSQGFSLVELLLVLAILGIISAIAIPSFLGQRRRARVIGDAKANAGVLRMQLEARRADTGTYGTAGTTYSWTLSSTPSASVNPAPNFIVSKGTTGMNYSLVVGSTGLTYTLKVTDTALGLASVYITNHNGSNIYTIK